MSDYKVLIGDCIKSMRTLPDQSVNCCVTSPPYFGLRDYGQDGQIGLEATPDAFVAALVAVFREVRRVLRDDGTVWLNLGDSYASGGGGATPHRNNNGGFGGSNGERNQGYAKAGGGFKRPNSVGDGIKAKDLIGIPWRVAFALQADGWYLRQDIIWHKPNPMPESVRDRCTKAHEYIFMLSKSPKYYYDHEAVKEPSVSTHASGNGFKRDARESYKNADGSARGNESQWSDIGGKRNRRSVWTVNTKPYAGAHFATFPPGLIEPCILAGCPEGGTVIDPFGGSGTTAGVAVANNRNAIMCELNPDYAGLIADRVLNITSKAKINSYSEKQIDFLQTGIEV
jgi:DNA modification methylase